MVVVVVVVGGGGGGAGGGGRGEGGEPMGFCRYSKDWRKVNEKTLLA